jgi:hypothetical protein
LPRSSRRGASRRHPKRAFLHRRRIGTSWSIKDFRPAIAKFQRQKGGKWCGDVFGLIVLPNVHETQKRLLKNRLSDLEAQLPRVGAKRTTWKEVHQRNYMVRVKKSGSPRVTVLGLCPVCTKNTEAT